MDSTYTVFARKYRPRKFSELVAQEPVSATLRNALRSGKVHHAYLFTGPRGVGKTTSARLLSKALNCPNLDDADPCGQCATCHEIAEGRHGDVLEIDGASNNGIQQVRELRENALYVPRESKFKIYIIDEVHMLSTSAFNGLLKTLEEPPPHVVFVMATTEPNKIPATVQSRCQRFDFKRITPEQIADRIAHMAEQESLQVDEEAIYLVARLADGSMRDAQSLLDQLVAFCGTHISSADAASVLGVVPDERFLDCTELVGRQAAAEVFPFVDGLHNEGHDPALFLRGFTEHLRTLLAITLGATPPEIERMPAALRSRFEAVAKGLPLGDLMRSVKLVGDAERSMRSAANARVELELLLVRLSLLPSTVNLEDVLQSLGSGGPPPPGGRTGRRQEHAREHRPSASPGTPAPRPGRAPRPPRADTGPGPSDTDRSTGAAQGPHRAREPGRAEAPAAERLPSGDPPAPPRNPKTAPLTPPDPGPGGAPAAGHAPAPRPTPTPGNASTSTAPTLGPSAPLTPTELDKLWPELTRRLQDGMPFLAASLSRCDRRIGSEGQIEIVLQSSAGTMETQLRSPETVGKLHDIASSILGRPLKVRFVSSTGPATRARRIAGGAPKEREQKELERIAGEEPLVQQVLDHFKIAG